MNKPKSKPAVKKSSANPTKKASPSPVKVAMPKKSSIGKNAKIPGSNQSTGKEDTP